MAEVGFAICHDLFDKPDEAIEYLEVALQKAELAKDPVTIRMVSEELIKIYQKLAEKNEMDAKDYDDKFQIALGFYEKCLQVCEKAGQRELQGKISNKIGKIYFNHKEYDKSIKHQKTVLELAEQIKNVSRCDLWYRVKMLFRVKWKPMPLWLNATWQSTTMTWQ